MKARTESGSSSPPPPTDLDRTAYGYDQAGNRLWCQNLVETTDQDELYTWLNPQANQ